MAEADSFIVDKGLKGYRNASHFCHWSPVLACKDDRDGGNEVRHFSIQEKKREGE